MSIKRIPGAVIVGNLVFTSGRTGGSGDVESQIKSCLEKLETTLKEAGSSFEHVVKATVYLSDLNYRSQYLNDIWRETFKENRPSRTCVEAGLGSADVEIEMIAVIP
jgi:2-iminobutanoate/2-iminopropanoate deaminase